MDLAELELEAEKKLANLKKRLGGFKAIELHGKKPSGLKAGMCYIIARERNLNVTQVQLAKIYGIRTELVHKDVKLLRRVMRN